MSDRIRVFEARDGSLVGLDRVGRASPRGSVSRCRGRGRGREYVERTSAVREPRCAEAQETRRAAPVAHSRSARRCERICSLAGLRPFLRFNISSYVRSLNRSTLRNIRQISLYFSQGSFFYFLKKK